MSLTITNSKIDKKTFIIRFIQTIILSLASVMSLFIFGTSSLLVLVRFIKQSNEFTVDSSFIYVFLIGIAINSLLWILFLFLFKLLKPSKSFLDPFDNIKPFGFFLICITSIWLLFRISAFRIVGGDSLISLWGILSSILMIIAGFLLINKKLLGLHMFITLSGVYFLLTIVRLTSKDFLALASLPFSLALLAFSFWFWSARVKFDK